MRIRWRVLGSFVAVAVVVVAVQALISGYVLRGTFLDNLETDLAREASELAVTLDGAGTGTGAALSDPGALETYTRAIGAATGVRVTVIAHDGTVLADSEDDPAAMGNHRDRPEVVAALAGGEGRARRVSATLRQEMLYVAVPTSASGLAWSGGVVRVAVPATRVDPILTDVVRLPLFVGLILLVPILVLGYLLSRSFTRPIERLRSMAVAVAGGDLSFRVGTDRRDELGELGEALNTMAGELEQRVDHLAAEQALSAEILTAMADGVLVVDATGTVVRANEAAAGILGVPAETLEGRPLARTARSFAARAIIDRARSADGPITEQIDLPDARTLWAQAVRLQVLAAQRRISTETQPGSAGTPATYRQYSDQETMVLLVFRDETARRRAEAQRRDLVANVSHELKTPLAGLSLLAATLRRVVREDPDEAERFASRLSAEVGRLDDLVADLLILSRLEEPGSATPELSTVDLAEIVQEVAIEVGPQAEVMRRTVNLQTAGPALLQGDGTQLATLVRNLVDNALRYTHPGGHVWIAVEPAADTVCLTVRDDGVGIPRDQQVHIFERFYRVDKARSRETGGTGLGLSIVKHVTERHGGRVEVESTVGVGSVFRVILPR